MTLSTLPLAITMGDPAGIGPEIIAKLAATERLSTPYVVIGDAGALGAAASLGLTLPIRELPASLADGTKPGGGETAVYSAGVALPGTCLSAGSMRGRGVLCPGGCRHRSGAGGAHRRYRHRTAEQGSDAPAGIDYPGHTEILGGALGHP